MNLLTMSVGDHHSMRFHSAIVEETIGNRKHGDPRNSFTGGKEAWNIEDVSGRHADEARNRRVVWTEYVRRRSICLTRLKKERQLLDGVGG